MKISTLNKSIAVILFLISQIGFSQKKDENIGTEVVNVVKPYSATISDAFKVKETPSLDDDDNSKKEEIQYNIFSFPVASTFTPAKGKAAGVDKPKKEKLYNNYATLGFGNYARIVGELFITEQLSRSDYVGGMLRHHSSQGGIEEVILDDKFYNTSLDVTYGSQQRNFNWTADLGYQHQVYNWYGIDQNYFNRDEVFYNEIDPSHTYHNFYLGGKIGMEDSFFTGASLKFNRFWDNFGSAENRFLIKPSFEFDIMEVAVKTNVIVDYVSGSFERNYFDLNEIKYGFTNFGLNPSISLTQDDWAFDIGVSLFYSADLENSDSKFFIYPNITASYKLVGDLMIFYAGADGNLQQNSYREFTNENPFLSPTLWVAPTSRPYDIFAGLKGKLAGNISYNVRGSFMQENDKALFRNNAFPLALDPALPTDVEPYAFGNSFDVVYDDVKTVSFFGEVKADLSKNISAGINGTFRSLSAKNQDEVWNLPSITFGANVDANITEKWYAGLNLFFVGERKDQVIIPDFSTFTTVTLDSYFDVNAHVGYKYNERLTLFLRGNNLFNQSYERWMNFPAQQIQVVLGANYKFDF
ncbi:TonB-dependent receptor [Flavobacterium piscinae]|uniref:TonB-dependent receptor n=2 Tax=Flavobacterium piscinae TaxID=2506424 RepID=A0A4Q1KQ30_9FLAO|nr:TonB-dependent receptor [Flavobacterium piscinae]RXR32108.1 TonB-dependent receptor [Flavobacterium piscinae]